MKKLKIIQESINKELKKKSLLKKQLKDTDNQIKILIEKQRIIQKEIICNQYKIKLNKSLTSKNQLIVDVSHSGNPIIKEKLKNGSWSKKNYEIFNFNWKTMSEEKIKLNL